jgi:23S rRNA (cytidine1920-2'-O)/16S rRNA (cytidine1409-2'-O)-methyltransferase
VATRERIDKLIVDRGLAPSRTRAQAMVLAGQVLVREQRIDKPGQMVEVDAEIRIKGEPTRYASRGGVKLEAALRGFMIDPAGKNCIDVGASTGGFTDCLLQHGAERVWALDVGHNQLVWKLRSDPRVVVIEGVNARDLSAEMFPVRFDIATVDVSFISLDKILPSLIRVITGEADCVVLIKPQFEVGRGEVGPGGVVTDHLKHRDALRSVVRAARAAGFAVLDLIESPIRGGEGNREFLGYLKPSGSAVEPETIDDMIVGMT